MESCESSHYQNSVGRADWLIPDIDSHEVDITHMSVAALENAQEQVRKNGRIMEIEEYTETPNGKRIMAVYLHEIVVEGMPVTGCK